MNNALYDGLAAGLFKDYKPQLKGFNFTNGAITQPLLNSAATYGRYYDNGQSLIVYSGSIQFASDTTFGSGESVWGISLPVPANRSLGGADIPLGYSWLWQGSAADPQVNMTCTPTLMDPLYPGGNQGGEDRYFQVFLPYLISFGTGSIATSATSTTITHNLGETPSARDVRVQATNAPSTTPKSIYVSNLTSTTFDVNVVSSSSTTGLTFAWEVVALPNSSSEFALLMNHTRPWTWASGHSISWQIEYEARR